MRRLAGNAGAFMRAVVTPSTASGRYSRGVDQATTATGVLRVVRRRPVVASIAIPATLAAGLFAGGAYLGTDAGDASTVLSAAPAVAQVENVERDERSAAELLADKVSSGELAQSVQGTSTTEVSAIGGGTISGDPCPVSSSIESGLSPNGVKVFRAVCAEFPSVKTYGGHRNDPGSDHHTGNAVDAMVRGQVGTDMSNYLMANAEALNVKYIIWEQKIWHPGGSWKPMSDRGGDTANHFDHVHISVK